MSLVPTTTVYSLRKRKLGPADPPVLVWALQHALNAMGAALIEDGVFGAKTRDAVKAFQVASGLAVDGIFGSASSRALATHFETRQSVALPLRLLHGQITAESGALLGAVNASVVGGTDCGYTQRRVYTADYDDEVVVRRAFDPPYQIALSAQTLRDRYELYLPRLGVQQVGGPLTFITGKHQRAWRLAALAHNWPYAADRLSRGYTLSDSVASWVPPGTRFADGAVVVTYWDWAKFYALGAPEHNHEPAITAGVGSWNVG